MRNYRIIFIVTLLLLTGLIFINATPVSHLTRKEYGPELLRMTQGQSIKIGNGLLVLNNQGNIVMWSNDRIVWASNTGGKCSKCLLRFQSDGNFVLYSQDGSSKAIYATGTSRIGKKLIITPHPPYLAIVDGAENVIWSATDSYESLVLRPGQFVRAIGKGWGVNEVATMTLAMQQDGNLVAYKNNTPVWASNTNRSHCNNKDTCQVALQSDGNLVMRDNGIPTWTSTTYGNNRLVLTTSGPKFDYEFPNFKKVFASTPKWMIHEGCNTLAYGTHPMLGNLMIGRNKNDVEPGAGCVGGPYPHSLTIVQMDWSQSKVSHKYMLLDTTRPDLWVENNSMRITNAGDPTVTRIRNEYWVAFECHGVNFEGASASCAGPMVMRNGRYEIDLARTSVVVRGLGAKGATVDPNVEYFHSASVPKIVAHRGKHYLFWSKLYMPKGTPGQADFLGASVWGTEVVLSNGKLRAKAKSGQIASGPIEANHPTYTTEVMKTNSTFSQTIDIFQILSKGDQLVAVGAGSKTCAYPTRGLKDCYKLFFAKTRDPLELNGFNKQIISNSDMPDSPMEYSMFLYRPSDKKTVFKFTNPFSGTSIYEWPDKLLFDYQD